MAGSLKRGTTLVELLVAMGLGALLLTVLYSILSQVFNVYGRSQARADLQNEALVALSRLISELRVTTLASVVVCSQPTAICYAVADTQGTFTGSAELLPMFSFCWLDAPSRQLMWKRWPGAAHDVVLRPNPFDTGRRLTAAEIAVITAHPNGTEKVLARGVDAFSVTPSIFPALLPVDNFTFQLNVSRPWRQETLSQTVHLTVMPRNEAAVLAPP